MYNILLVEDEKDTARCVKEAFELEDIAVDVAYDGREGLNKFHEKEYDLILLLLFKFYDKFGSSIVLLIDIDFT